MHGTDGKGAYSCARQGSSSPDGQNARGRAKRGGRYLSNQPHPLARLPEGRVAVCGLDGRRVIFLSNENCRIHSLRLIFLAHAATLDQAREATSQFQRGLPWRCHDLALETIEMSSNSAISVEHPIDAAPEQNTYVIRLTYNRSATSR